ncbi:hypothetical protein N234_31815 [Ralstonia pickettii DTP0602]|nr:hypothetical protein N234_31815 [Ralstonia pickettii DTP0602]
MRVEEKTVELLTISDAPNLDTITVVLEPWSERGGRITIMCYGKAWCASWGAMGSPLADFVASNHPDYVVDNLFWGTEPILKRREAHERAYVTRIVMAVQQVLRNRAATPPAADKGE